MNGINNWYVVDTNPIIYFTENIIPALPAGKRLVSIITEMELLVYPDFTLEKEQGIRDFLNSVTIVPLTEDIKREAIRIRRDGVPRLKLPDAIIAATAVILGTELVTEDTNMLKLVWPGLKTVTV
jgi:predicted nucleic acid-binding protein